MSLFLTILAEASDPANQATSGKVPVGYLLVGLAILMLSVILLIRTRRRIARSQERTNLSAGQRVERLAARSDMTDRIGDLMAELADLSRQINGQLDSRMAKLEILLARADDMIQQLNAAAGDDGSDASAETLSSDEYAKRIAEGIDDQVRLGDGYSNKGSAGDSSGESASAENSFAPSPLSERDSQVVKLSKEQGLSPVEIAHRLGYPVGEVELILALRCRNRSGGGDIHRS